MEVENIIAPIICGIIALYAALRIILEKNTLRKLPYLNVLGFAVAGSLVLLIDHPLVLPAAVAFFVGSTLESNAIASTIAGGKKDD